MIYIKTIVDGMACYSYTINQRGFLSQLISCSAYQPIARALCDGDLITQSSWQPIENCGAVRDVSELLVEISEVCSFPRLKSLRRPGNLK